MTSPPYWTLKEYRESEGQMGAIEDYEHFLAELRKVWRHCFEALVPGGRLIAWRAQSDLHAVRCGGSLESARILALPVS
jgi:hypothetical protein